MQEDYNKKIRPLLDAYDRISEILRNEPIPMPKIVVVGDQSSGKSSVLESITGIDTPRGQNTVTRGPIVIQIRRTMKSSDECAFIWSEKKEKQKITLGQIGESILSFQKTLISEQSVEITSTPVYIEVNKIDAPDLTLYDLPGLTYKNEKMTGTIKRIIEDFTRGNETLILLITPANTDLTTSEALSLCRKNEGFEDRTIAVVTKIELGSSEKGIYGKIMENELGLKYPPIVVRNRTQEEVDQMENWEEIRRREMQLFRDHPDLCRLPDASKGTNQLITRLIELQKETLLSSRYDIMEKIQSQLGIKQSELSKLPASLSTTTEKQIRFESCLDQFIKNVKRSIKGKMDGEIVKKNIAKTIRKQLEKDSENFNKNNDHFFSDEFALICEEKISDTREFNLSNFINSNVFKMIMRDHISKATSKILHVLDTTADEMKKNLNELSIGPFSSHLQLQKAIQNELNRIIDSQKTKVKDFLTEVTDMETEQTYTSNAYYMDLYSKINKLIAKQRKRLHKINGGTVTSLNQNNGGLPNIYNYQPPSLNQHRQNNDIESDEENAEEQVPARISIGSEMHSRLVEINDCRIPAKILFSDRNLNAFKQMEVSVLNFQICCFAYWKTIEKRFLDYYHINIIKNIVNFFKDKLKDDLHKKFSPSLNESAKDLIFESTLVTNQRNKLKKSIEDLLDAEKEMANIM